MLGSLQSEALLSFRHDTERDRTVLHRRRTGGLCHVSKPYWDGTVLGAQVVNPTAGLFAGDELRMRVEVGDGARVSLTSPSASRFHAMGDCGGWVEQEFDVGAGAWLEFRPDLVIPQGKSRVSQTTRLTVAEGGEVVFFDLLAPGRVAHGESYQYQRYSTTLELELGGSLVARERMVLSPEDGGWPLRVPGWEVSYYGAVWLVGAGVTTGEEVLAKLERQLDSEGVRIGVSALTGGVAVVRVLAARSVLLKNSLSRVREAVEGMFPLLRGGRRTLQNL